MVRNPRDGEASEPERGNNSASSPRSKIDLGEDVEPKMEVVNAGGEQAVPSKMVGESAEIRSINYPNGDAYEGELKNSKAHGKGVCRFVSGSVYDGEWKDNEQHGVGTLTLANGYIYEGDWAEGKFHGKGTLKGDGFMYDGEWKDNMKHGKGKQRGHDGSVYEGEYKDNLPHGWGKYTWPAGNVYEGEWVGGERQGNGTMNYSWGDVYEGDWVKGEKHGKGTMKYSSGNIYEGIWTEGRMTQGKKTAGRDERKGAGHAPTSCELPERKLRSQRSQQRRLQAATKACEHCGADNYRYKLRVCTGCNLALYCSAACQKAASGSHRRICDIISELPSSDTDRLLLEYDKDKLVDLDAGLRYGTKYLDNLKHLQINLKKMARNDSAKLSAKHLSSLLKQKKGALDSVFWLSNHFIQAPGICGHDDKTVWKELHGLKQLRLQFVTFDNVQPIIDIIDRQRNSLLVLWLPCLGIDWHKAKCRRTFAQAVNSCKHLVKLDLQGSVLMDPDLKVMLHDLPNLRVLHLGRNPNNTHEFTDNTCGLIARKCPGLQELNLDYHNHLSARGIRKVFEGCANLRLFYTTTCKLSCGDIRELLDTAPQLLYLSLNKELGIAEKEIDELIEATGGRTGFQFTDGDTYNQNAYDPGESLSAETRAKYQHLKQFGVALTRRSKDPEVANEWEDQSFV